MKSTRTSSWDAASDGYGPGGTRPLKQRSSSSGPSGRSSSSGRTGRTGRRRWPMRLLKVVLAVLVIAGVAFGGLYVLTPSVSEAPVLVQDQAAQHNIGYPGVQPPPRFTEALVATEDHRFYSNPGVDIFAVARLVAGKISGHADQGGSTLEQQLAKNLYTAGRSGFTVEAEQVMLALKLNMSYTKAQILRMYAEVAYYGNQYYGLQQASCGYFGVQPAQLSWPEAALLAGVVNAPTADDPRTNPQNARAREVHVIDRLMAVGDLSQSQGKAVLSQTLDLAPQGQGCSG